MIDNKIPRARGQKKPAQAPKASGQVFDGDRIAKVMARAGLCSRRDAEAWIAEGRVAVNGQVLASPAFNVKDGDEVKVDGKPLAQRERTRLFLFHKPRGLVTTNKDPEGRPTIFDALPEDAPRLIAVGRLDINTEGLILLTNDGGLARVLELPATGWLRRYRVRAHGEIEQAALDTLAAGVTIDGVDYAGIEAVLDRSQGSNVWLTMGLREGKNREIKRVLEHLGVAVNRLIRLSFGPFQLGDLEEGQLVEVRTRVLREQIGARLAREAGADFDGPLNERAESEDRQRPTPDAARQARRKRPEPSAGDRRRERAPALRFESRDAPRRDDQRQPRKHKYIGAIRAERDDAERGPRRRIERGATSDRKGREIKVERLQSAVVTDDRRDAKRAGAEKAPRRRFSREEEGAQPRQRAGRSAGDGHNAPRSRFSRDGEPSRPPARIARDGTGDRQKRDAKPGRGAPRGEKRPGAPQGPRGRRGPPRGPSGPKRG